MCGIAGVISPSLQVAERAVHQMNAAQSHRGPDGEGLVSFSIQSTTLTLGHRRLAILDLSEAGHQPMTNPATDNWIVFNGEIYNFRSLRNELKAAGHLFSSSSDTEVVLRAYEQWGERCFERLHGMFAVAIYDAHDKQLVLARDHLGIKPLYVAQSSEAFVFASELQAIQTSCVIPNDVDRCALAGLLAYGSVPEPLTMLKNVRVLPPGTCTRLRLNDEAVWRRTLRSKPFWRFPQREPITDLGRVSDDVRQRLNAAVDSHLVSDVPVGLFLSSGLDSNAIAALVKDQGHIDAVEAFTVSIADVPEMDEGAIASSIARNAGFRFHDIRLSEDQLCREAEHFWDAMDQPTVDGLNSYIVSGAVRQRGIKVALSGLGGDEIFGGYSSFREVPRLHRWHQLTGWTPRSWRGALARQLYRNASPSQQHKAVELARTPTDLAGFCLRRRRLFSDVESYELGFDPELLNLDKDWLPPESDVRHQLSGHDAVGVVSILESRFYMSNTLLRDSDVFGMAHGLEIRVPMLDRGLVELAYSLPGDVRVRKSQGNKPVLAAAMGTSLPTQLKGLKKRGFCLPVARWMLGPLRDRVEDSLSVVGQSGLFDPAAVKTTWDRFQSYPEGPEWSRAWLLASVGNWMSKNSTQLPNVGSLRSAA
jgi:asparagine synthase (glutamine-hydrolysing)